MRRRIYLKERDEWVTKRNSSFWRYPENEEEIFESEEQNKNVDELDEIVDEIINSIDKETHEDDEVLGEASIEDVINTVVKDIESKHGHYGSKDMGMAYNTKGEKMSNEIDLDLSGSLLSIINELRKELSKSNLSLGIKKVILGFPLFLLKKIESTGEYKRLVASEGTFRRRMAEFYDEYFSKDAVKMHLTSND